VWYLLISACNLEQYANPTGEGIYKAEAMWVSNSTLLRELPEASRSRNRTDAWPHLDDDATGVGDELGELRRRNSAHLGAA
jgi:hypothetical protein